MKFHYKDWVVCTDIFYKSLEAPGARESETNKRLPARGEILDYQEVYVEPSSKKKPSMKMEYLVSFTGGGPSKWINEDFLELYSDRDGPIIARR